MLGDLNLNPHIPARRSYNFAIKMPFIDLGGLELGDVEDLPEDWVEDPNFGELATGNSADGSSCPDSSPSYTQFDVIWMSKCSKIRAAEYCSLSSPVSSMI